MKVVKMLDDIDKTEAAETVPFAIDGMAFEIDLSEANAARFREVMAEFVAHARPVVKAPKGKARKASKSSADYDPRELRAWWKAQGPEMGLPAATDRARIPNVVIESAREHAPALFAAAPLRLAA
jgi:hypothetical protein